MENTKQFGQMWFWFGSKTYGGQNGRYYGFNLFNRLSVHYCTKGEIALQIGDWLKFWTVAA